MFLRLRRPHLGGIIVGAVLVVAGCGPARPTVAPVSGVVSYLGKPLTAGSVTFVPADGGPPAVGDIGKDGRYRLTTFDTNDGALLGNHRIAVVALKATADPLPGETDRPSGPGGLSIPPALHGLLLVRADGRGQGRQKRGRSGPEVT
jgi:hypothetical protein